MKLTKILQAISLLAFLGFAISCKENANCNNGIMNGNETGIDCGGDCPACPVTNEADPRLFGNWYLAYFDSLDFFDDIHLKVFTGANYRVEIINENTSTTDTPIYKIKGGLGSNNSYPTEGTLTYNAATIAKIQKLNNDTLIYDGYVYVKNASPYEGEPPYLKFRLYTINNECGDSSIITSQSNGTSSTNLFYNSTQPYMEVIAQHISPVLHVHASFNSNVYVWGPTNATTQNLSWYVPNPTRNYNVTYRVQVLDRNNNILSTSAVKTKTIWGNDLSNKFWTEPKAQWIQ